MRNNSEIDPSLKINLIAVGKIHPSKRIRAQLRTDGRLGI